MIKCIRIPRNVTDEVNKRNHRNVTDEVNKRNHVIFIPKCEATNEIYIFSLHEMK